MSNSKISALTSATTPLAGTEVVPIVQSGATVKATIANIVGAGTSLVWGTSGWFTSRTAPSSGVGVEVFSSGGNGQILAFNRSTVAYTSLIYDANYHQWNISGVVSAYIDSSKNLNIASGNIIPTTAAKGINFTANTPAAGKTSQLLNWYEEGTFVATLTPNTSGSITLSSNNTLSYTRMGRVVVVNGLIDVASVSLPVGTYVLITTLPFTPATISPNAGRSGGAFGVLSTTAGNITPGLLINGGLATTYIAMNASTVQTGTSFYVQFTYITA